MMATTPTPNNGSNPNGKAATVDDYIALDQEAAVQVEPTIPPADNVPRFKRLTWADVMALPPKEWLIDQILGRGDLIMVYGAPSSGKTFVGFDLAFAACLGKPWAGRFEVPQRLTVAYAAGEGGSGLAQRLQAAGEYYGVDDIPNLHIYMTAPQLFNIQDPCNAAQFVLEYAAAQAEGDVAPLDVLILDTLHSVSYGAGENDTKDMGEVLRQARGIADRLGCAVILVHHTNKSGTAERGSSALRGAMDCMIEVKEVGSSRLMTCEKLKDGEAWKPQIFDLVAKADSVRVEWGDVGASENRASRRAENTEILKAFLMDSPNRGFPARHLSGLIAGSESDVHKAMKPLVESGSFTVRLAYGDKPARGNPLLWAYSL